MRRHDEAWGIRARWRAPAWPRPVAACVLALAPLAAWADTVRLAGSLTLVGRNADIAMVAAPLEVAIAAAATAGKKVDAGALRVHVRSDDIVFVVGASNRVARLTLAQLGDIQTGRIRNWKEVGGKDLPITVYTTAASSGTTSVVRKLAMNGGDYAPGTRTMLSFARMVELLPNDEGGIGALGRGFVKADGKLRVIETPRMTRPLALVTLGEPSPAARQVIDAMKVAATGARLDVAALCATQVRPEMPRKALQEGIEGVMQAQAVIRDGVVRDVTIVSGPRGFQSAVRDAMLQYKCARGDGREVVAAQEFVFKARTRD